jgi:hypothetical protein
VLLDLLTTVIVAAAGSISALIVRVAQMRSVSRICPRGWAKTEADVWVGRKLRPILMILNESVYCPRVLAE